MNADDIIITPEDIASLTYKFKENIYFMAIFDFSKYNSKMLKEAVFIMIWYKLIMLISKKISECIKDKMDERGYTLEK